MVWLTLALTIIGLGALYISWDTERRDLRAYISAADPELTPNGPQSAAKWHLEPIWTNAGKTPTRNAAYKVSCIVQDSTTGKWLESGVSNSDIHDIGPSIHKHGGDCLVDGAKIKTNQQAGQLNGIMSEITYDDVFGDHHVSRQCFLAKFNSDPTISPSEYSTLLCGHDNCEDGECKETGSTKWSLEFWLQITSAISGIAAAALWLWSSLIIIPDTGSMMISGPKSPSGYMKKQSRISAFAAGFAAIAAVLQTCLMWIAI